MSCGHSPNNQLVPSFRPIITERAHNMNRLAPSAGQSRQSRWCSLSGRFRSAAVIIGVMALSAGCVQEVAQKKPVVPYNPTAHDPNLPDYLKGSLYDRTFVLNNEPFNVSAFSLVGQLRGTGSCVAPPSVRSYMIKELARRGFGDPLVPVYGKIQPNEVLADPNYAIVRVDGEIPPGARKGDWFDVRVSTLPGSPTRSLAHGVLFETDLKNNGADKNNPVGAINVLATCKGPILVNPAYALTDDVNPTGPARSSLRSGIVMFNGVIKQDRPLFLQLRDPQHSTARSIENRIWDRFQLFTDVAAAQDEGIISLKVPPTFHGDWQHFIGVVQHLFLNNSPEFNARKAKELVVEAHKPNAALDDISYCWEGLGKDALPFILPLLLDDNQDVAYAAARAAVFIGDNTGAAEQRLIQMAQTTNHPFRLSAVQTLGLVPSSAALNTKIRDLLNCDEAMVRIEAYRVLAQNGDHSVFTKFISPSNDPENEKFALDIVESDAPPHIYASRQGAPRIAIIGKTPSIRLPIVYTAMDDRLTISSIGKENYVTMAFRDPLRRDLVKVLSLPTVTEIIARLGGAGARDEDHMNFAYGEVLAVLQALSDSNQLAVDDGAGHLWGTAFVLQDMPRTRDIVREAAPMVESPRPGPDLSTLAPAATTAPIGAANVTHGPLY
jgi:hypothetical protein